MESPEKIPVLKPKDLDDFHHFNIDWKPAAISETKHQFYHINRLEDYISYLQLPYPPHRKTIHDFIYITKGSSKRSKGLSRYNFGEAELFFLPAHQITEHESMSLDVEGYFCHFDEVIFSFLPKNYLSDTYSFFQLQSNPIINIREESQSYLKIILERLLFLYEDEKERNITLIAKYLLVFFEELKKELPAEPKKSKDTSFQVTELYKNALAKHIYQIQSVPEYAQILNISANYLNKCVKKCVNKTSQDLLNEMLILEAKTLLKYSNLQIAEIAIKLCDQTPSNFTRFFKSQTGITPKEYLELY